MADKPSRSGAEVVIDAIVEAGAEVAFGYPGGAIMPLYDALLDSPIEHILTRHEQAAIHAADGYARASGRLGVCIATSGPGATNLVTGICTAMMDSVPILCVTGQVTTPTIGTDAFQEADVFGVVTPITKQVFLARSLGELPELIAEAIYIATTGRPGPVLVDVPKNVLSGRTTARASAITNLPGYEPVPALDDEAIDRAHALLLESRRPVCIIGGGCKLSGATAAFRAWCERSQVPVVATLNGIGAPDPAYAGWLGMLGMHGLRRANLAVAGADLIIGMGMRFDDRVTGRVDMFARDKHVVHIDIDAAELGKIIPVDVPVAADLRPALEAWSKRLDARPARVPIEWQREVASAGTGLQVPRVHEPDRVSAIEVLDALFELIGPETFVTTDVGQHQMWAAQRCNPSDPRHFITSGGAGTMGYGLPAAMGAQRACPGRRVVAISGDGGFQMNMAELATIRRCNLPVKILVLDNRYLGMVRQWQEMFHEHRYSAVDMSDNPDFAAMARLFGITGFSLKRRESIRGEIESWWHCDGPALLHCVCQLEENVFPMVPSNTALGDMVEAAE